MMLDVLARAKDGEGVKSGPIGLAVILVLCVAAYFLFRSMSRHLRTVRENFPAGTTTPVQPGSVAGSEAQVEVDPIGPGAVAPGGPAPEPARAPAPAPAPAPARASASAPAPAGAPAPAPSPPSRPGPDPGPGSP